MATLAGHESLIHKFGRVVAGTVLRDVFGRATTPDGHRFALAPKMNVRDCYDLWAGRYEAPEIKMMREYFHPDSSILELGSNIGVVTSYAFLEKLLDGGVLSGFEPNPESFPTLRANMNNIRNRRPSCTFNLFAVAVAPPAVARHGWASFDVRRNLSSALKGVVSPELKSREERVKVISLKKVVERLAPDGASLVMDIEGSEYDLFRQDPESLAKIRQMAIEIHGPELTKRPDQKPEELAAFIRTLGFRERARAGNTWVFARPGAF